MFIRKCHLIYENFFLIYKKTHTQYSLSAGRDWQEKEHIVNINTRSYKVLYLQETYFQYCKWKIEVKTIKYQFLCQLVDFFQNDFTYFEVYIN